VQQRLIRKPIEELDEASWDLIQDTNLKASFLCSRAAARFMKEQRMAIAIGDGFKSLFQKVRASCALAFPYTARPLGWE
jgi:NAD(P)-dependent dehydrogenase (short-subunit alcohol dehydrogenase family)